MINHGGVLSRPDRALQPAYGAESLKPMSTPWPAALQAPTVGGMNHRENPDDVTQDDRHDQLTTAPDATEADAAPRIEVSEHDGNTRIDIAPDAAVRPGPGPGAPGADAE